MLVPLLNVVEFFCNVFAPHCSLTIWLGCEENSEKIFAAVLPRVFLCTLTIFDQYLTLVMLNSNFFQNRNSNPKNRLKL